MYIVSTEVRLSPIHGLGVFALKSIVFGDTVWRFDPIIDRIIRQDEISYLPSHVQEYLRVRSTTDIDGHYRISLDSNQYTNHSYEPNLIWDFDSYIFSADRDIEVGEELTKDYRQYSLSRYAKSL